MIKVYPEVPLLQPSLIDDGAGYYPTKISFDVEGFTYGVNNVRVDVTNIGGATAVSYVFPASPIQMRVQSASANDTAAGTGVRTVKLHYLDTNYAVQTEIVTLNGVTPVNTVATNILRVNEMHAMSVGSGGAPAGDITLTDTTGAVVYARLELGFNRSRSAVFTIPAGMVGYISHWNGFCGSTTGTHYTRFTLRTTAHDNVLIPGVFLAVDALGGENNGANTYYDIPIRCPAKTDLKVSVISDAGAAGVMANSHFSGWYEPA